MCIKLFYLGRENAKFKSQKQIWGSKMVRRVKYKPADGCARAPGCTSRQVRVARDAAGGNGPHSHSQNVLNMCFLYYSILEILKSSIRLYIEKVISQMGNIDYRYHPRKILLKVLTILYYTCTLLPAKNKYTFCLKYMGFFIFWFLCKLSPF